jgi:hypothetical protein
MSLNKKLSGAVAAAALAAMNVTAFAGAAEARDWNSRGDRGGYAYNDRDHRSDYRDYGRQRAYDSYRERKKDKTARNVAIGLGVLMLGAILASQANHGHRY